MNIQIELNTMRFYAYHGVGQQERAVGNYFVIDLLLTADVERATESDALDDTVNYAEVYAAIKQEMEQPSKLLEAVAGRIAKRLRLQFPQIVHLKVKIAKLNPPFGGDVYSAAVILED